jgi:hypothetical protein
MVKFKLNLIAKFWLKFWVNLIVKFNGYTEWLHWMATPNG